METKKILNLISKKQLSYFKEGLELGGNIYIKFLPLSDKSISIGNSVKLYENLIVIKTYNDLLGFLHENTSEDLTLKHIEVSFAYFNKNKN